MSRYGRRPHRCRARSATHGGIQCQRDTHVDAVHRNDIYNISWTDSDDAYMLSRRTLGPNARAMEAKWEELRANGLQDMKIHGNFVGADMEALCGELLSIIDIYERGAFEDITEKLD